MKIKADWFTYLHNLRRKEISIIFSNCPNKIFNKCLEIGAGDGFQSTILTKYVSELICTDINPDIKKKKSMKSIKYLRYDAKDMDIIFDKKEFDLIYSSNVLEHLTNPNNVLNSMTKILKDNGILIHIMPTPFWKVCSFLLAIPNNILTILEYITKKERFNKKQKLSNNSKGNVKLNKQISYGIISKIKKFLKSIISFIYNIIVIGGPHGASTNHIREFFGFSKHRWKKEFKKANLELIKIKKGIVASGHGFGFDHLRKILEKLGLSSENIYIAIKRNRNSPYKIYF